MTETKKLCLIGGCRKKIFLNGYCHSHISHAREKTKLNSNSSLSENDLIRRANKIKEFSEIEKEIDSKREFIKDLKRDNNYSNQTLYEIKFKEEKIRTLEQELLDFIELTESEIDEEINKFTQYMKDKGLSGRMYNFEKCYKSQSTYDFDSDSDSDSNSDSDSDSDSDSKTEQNSNSKSKSGSKSNSVPLNNNSNSKIDKAFEILDISKTSSILEIKKAYYNKAKLIHPDKNTNKNDGINYHELFANLANAYEFLISKY